MITLRKITPRNYRKILALKVSEEQEKFVASNSGILAKAFAYHSDSRVYAICSREAAVGLALVRSFTDMEDDYYVFDQIMIDKGFQGKGYGKAAVELILEELKKEKKHKKVCLCYVEGDEVAKRLYEGLGFRHTGFVDECEGEPDEIEMCLYFNH